jgi:hypothetical protein
VNLDNNAGDNVDLADIEKRSDMVREILHARLDQHIRARVRDVKKLDHDVWKFVRDNLGRVGAMMVYLVHVKNDVKVSLRCSVSKGTFPLESGERSVAWKVAPYFITRRTEILYEVARLSVP